MEFPKIAALARRGPAEWGWTALVVFLGAVAYRPLLVGVSELPTAGNVDRWLFQPSSLPAPLVLAAAAWCFWRRRERLFALQMRAAPWTAAALAGLGAVGFVWALRTRAPDLLFLSLAAHLLAFAALARGRAGCHALALPALVLLLGVRLPAPLLDEFVWRLQLSTAAGASWLLDAVGREFIQGGVTIRNDEHSFEVIDACSGIQGIQILTLIAILTRELFADSGTRQWLLVALAPVLGFALNVIRIAYVAASPNPEALAGIEGDHTPQGVAVLVVGTGILYGLAAWMASSVERGRHAPDASPAEWSAARGRAAAWLAVLALLQHFVTPFSPRSESAAVSPKTRFPETGTGWSSEPLHADPFFLGSVRYTHRRFELQAKPPQVVELLVGRETPGAPQSSQLMTTKLNRPGPDWDLVRSRRERLWMLGRDAVLSLASRPPGGEHSMIYTWRLRDRGLWRESWRSLLALDSSPFGRERSRTIVRLLTYAPHDGSLALDFARQRLNRFIADFREELAEL